MFHWKKCLAGGLVAAALLVLSCEESGTTTDTGSYTEGLTRDSDLSVPSGSKTADHNAVHEIWKGRVAVSAIEEAKTELHIAYGHTSHGSQLISGMGGIPAFASAGNMDGSAVYSTIPGLFDWSHDGSGGSLHLREGDGYGTGPMDHDAGYFSDTWDTDNQQNWYEETVQFLDDPDNGEYNVVIWSWCGQLSWMTTEQVGTNYLDPMTTLRTAYPDIVFVCMTGHLDGTGVSGNLNANNDIIREYCDDNDCWLYDFADIESYDPDGYFIMELSANDECRWDSNNDETIDADDRNWAREWQDAHTQDADWFDSGAAHSESIIGNMKGYAAWWLWARIAEEME
jgi:hypothetical protein